MKHTIILISLIFTCFSLQAKLQIVTAINPYLLITSQIADTLAEVENLLPPYASPHTYSPLPSDILKLTKADLIIMNGMHLEEGIMRKLKDIKGKVIVLSDSLGYLDGNPHIWLSPENGIRIGEIIKNALIRNDSINRDLYEKNYLNLKKGVNDVDSVIKLDIKKYGTFSVIAFHNSFNYFLEHYGIELAGLIEKIPGREPSPKDLLELKQMIEEKGISVLFTEPELSDKGAQVLGKEMDLSLYTIDPLGNIFDINRIDELYIKNYNVLIRARK